MSDQIIIILNRPQKPVNIGGAVRAMLNMGCSRLRLVSPVAYDRDAISAMAHRSEDILDRTETFDSLEQALADLHYIVGSSARRRSHGPIAHSPRELAPEILRQASSGPVGIVFGPEDNGLTSAELDLCHAILTIPSIPSYSSFNLAQAVLLVAYELHLAEPVAPETQPQFAPASSAQLEALFQTAEQALNAIEFFKSGQSTSSMRSLRTIIHRAQPDQREVALLTAMYREIINYIRRNINPS